MKHHSNHKSCIAATPRGFTLLELIVAMAVFGITLTGLVPLIAVLSRDLQPVVGQKGRSPARDWNDENCKYVDHRRSTWYLTANDSDNPWVRKLGASARITSSAVTSYTPFGTVPLQSPVLFLDNYDPSGGSVSNDTDGVGTYTCTGWTYDGSATAAFHGDQHRKDALAAGGTSTGDAAWSFTISVAGSYSIQATWKENATDQINDAQFTYKINSGTPVAVTVNQTLAPVGGTASGVAWAPLTSGLIPLAKGDVVEVRLSDVRATSAESGKYVVADAVRIVQNTVKIKSVERSLNGTRQISATNPADATAKVSVTVNVFQ